MLITFGTERVRIHVNKHLQLYHRIASKEIVSN